jgi:hypothetical protein
MIFLRYVSQNTEALVKLYTVARPRELIMFLQNIYRITQTNLLLFCRIICVTSYFRVKRVETRQNVGEI